MLDDNDKLCAGTLPDDPLADAKPMNADAPDDEPPPSDDDAPDAPPRNGRANRMSEDRFADLTPEQRAELDRQRAENARSNRHNAPPRERTATDPSDAASWPDPLAAEAFHGLAGEIVNALAPQTEADPAALLVQFLGAFGNAIGNKPHFVADGALHGCKLFVAIVGATAKGRKGTSLARAVEPFKVAIPEWAGGEGHPSRIMSGLSSGEGLIWQIRDPISKRELNRKTRQIEEVIVDKGVDDKRALVVEPELASTMAVMARQGNTLSSIVRAAWDGSELRALTKNSPAHSTGAHVSIIGHVTRDELRRNLDRTELGNGFANRFLWICAKRSKTLPFGGEPVELRSHADRLRAVYRSASAARTITWAQSARQPWEDAYPKLSEGRPGILGAVTARAEAQVLRLACIYALLDESPVIEIAHLRAAFAVWRYAFDSARWVWGDALGDPAADELLALLRAHPRGLTATEIRDHFGRHRSSDVARAKQVLLAHALAERIDEPTAGRSAERWLAMQHATKATKATKGDAT